MIKQLLQHVKDALLSILPVTLTVILLHFTGLVPLGNNIITFVIGAAFLLIGLILFNIGVSESLLKVGEMIGSSLVKVSKFPLLILIVFIMGFVITSAEPSVMLLATQTPINRYVFVFVVAGGVGLYLVLAVLKVIFNKHFNVFVITTYVLIFGCAILVAPEFLPMAFDSSGVATGVVTVPFIIAIGTGVAMTLSKRRAQEDSFGFVGFAILGPILFVIIMGIFSDKPTYSAGESGEVLTISQMILNAIKHAAIDNALVLVPILVFFVIYQVFYIKLSKRKLLRIGVGFIYVYIGLLLFIAGANIGYVPIGNLIGEVLVNKNNLAIMLTIIALIGGLACLAEPSVHFLGSQVEEISDGTIKKTTLVLTLAGGVCISMMLSVIRVYFDFSFMYFIVPGYFIAVALTFIVPRVYTSIAFDGGGAVSSALTASFLAPIIMGVTMAIPGRDLVLNGLGTIGLISMMPLITIQLLGFGAMLKERAAIRISKARRVEEYEAEIIYFN